MADAANRESGGAAAIWRGLLNAEGGYDVADFRSLAPADATGLDALLDGAQDIEAEVIGTLRRFGAQVELADPGADAWSNAALWPFLHSTCTGQMGIFTNDGRYHLDTGNRCGVLSGAPEAIAIGGHDLSTHSARAFDAVEQACAATGAVVLTLKIGDEVSDVSVICDAATERPQLRYAVAGLS